MVSTRGFSSGGGVQRLALRALRSQCRAKRADDRTASSALRSFARVWSSKLRPFKLRVPSSELLARIVELKESTIELQGRPAKVLARDVELKAWLSELRAR